MVNKDMTVGEILGTYTNAKEILGGFGLHCFGCPMSQMETLEEASMAHGIELDLLVEKLNELKQIENKFQIGYKNGKGVGH